VQASQGAFAALLHDGSVVTWGDVDYGGESQVYKACIQGVKVGAILRLKMVISWDFMGFQQGKHVIENGFQLGKNVI
jgi:hypothetical protein